MVSLVTLPLAVLAFLTLFEVVNWGKISPGVTVLGADIGGMSRAEAVARLLPSVQQLLDRPLDITAANSGQTWHTTARDLGLRLDADELVGAAYDVGRSGGPLNRLGDQMDALARGRAISLDNTTDVSALDDALNSMATQINRAPVDATLVIGKDGTIQSTDAQPGAALDLDASRQQLSAALNGRGQSVSLVVDSVPPAVPDRDLQSARDQLDRWLGPDAPTLTLTFEDQSWPLDHAALAKLVSLTGGRNTGQPAAISLDDKALQDWVAGIARQVDQPVQNARFAFNGGNLKVLRPSAQGRSVDQAALVQAVHDALLSGSTTVQLPFSTVDPTVTEDDGQSLGITDLIDKGSTSFAGSIPEKVHNIQLAAQRLNGVVVPPGATFSFNDSVGPTTIDAGFEWGFGIESGDDGPRTVPSVAGGICQVATTLFQPVFWAGYQLEQRYWHLYWIPAYTSRGVVGLDVTVDSDSGLDFKWTNTTSNAILIQADADDSNIYFGLYGKKPPWQVKVDDAKITNRTPPDPTPLAQAEPTLPWGRTLVVETARDGFDAEVVRHVIPTDGGKERDLDLKSSYQPARTVTLVGSKGKPASANMDAAIQHVLDAQKPVKPAPAPAAPVPARPTATAVAPPKPQAQPTVRQATPANGIAPTPTPAH
ncbi:MAG: VanW family protein [Chloroflexi bacterium]|nr:VanW family protein [Chloroflexota bacterium]